VAGNQATTRAWWNRRSDFELFLSVFVLDEVQVGDPQAISARLQALAGIPQIDVSDQVVKIADELLLRAGLPAKARLDALHIGAAAYGGMDYLLTWNCTHIANPAFRSRIEAVIRSFGCEPPVICTPQELIEV
jgi:hypothetical protein